MVNGNINKLRKVLSSKTRLQVRGMSTADYQVNLLDQISNALFTFFGLSPFAGSVQFVVEIAEGCRGLMRISVFRSPGKGFRELED